MNLFLENIHSLDIHSTPGEHWYISWTHASWPKNLQWIRCGAEQLEQREGTESERSPGDRHPLSPPEQMSVIGMQVPSLHWNCTSGWQEPKTVSGNRARRSTVKERTGCILRKIR